MADKTKIQWADATWNPITGCDKISPGCDRCYAERIAERFKGTKAYPNGFGLTIHRERFPQPIRWTAPRRIFVNSMSDLFHKDIADEVRDDLFTIMLRAPQHQYLILTKRSSIMRDYINGRRFPLPLQPCLTPSARNDEGTLRVYETLPPNFWLGVSVEDGARGSRIEHLRQTKCSVRFLSVEPLIGDPGILDLRGIHWVIVGGESGQGARPMNPFWATSILEQCRAAGVPFFMKQMGGQGKQLPFENFPEMLRVREFPTINEEKDAA